MQEYSNFEDTEYISDAPTKLNKNMQSIITDFSGASFPTANLFVGMKCLRTDENKVYRLYENASNQLVWQLEYTIVDGGIKVKQADVASSATQASNDANNKAITDYIAGVAVGSAQGKIKVTDGAGTSTEFTSYTIATQSETEKGMNNNSMMTPFMVNAKIKQWIRGDAVDISPKTIESLRNKILEYATSETKNTFLVSMDNVWITEWNAERTTQEFGYGQTWSVTITDRASSSYFSFEVGTYFLNENADFVRVKWRGSYYNSNWSKLLRYASNDKLSMPSNQFITISVNQGFNNYVAPADGWIRMGLESNINGICQLYNITGGVISMMYLEGGLYWGGSIPCSKGDTLQIGVPAAGSIDIKFFYAQSEV